MSNIEQKTVVVKRIKPVYETIEGSFHISEFVVKRTRKNEKPDHFDTCDYCLGKIDQNGELGIQLASMDLV